MLNKGMYTSNTDMWATPQLFFNKLNEIFHFDIDVCAVSANAKCQKYFTPENDGLKQKWIGCCYMNPPYGRHIGEWVEKARTEGYRDGTTVVCLLPARTDTKYVFDCIFEAAACIVFLKGRLKFGDGKNSAPFPSMVCVFGQITDEEITGLKSLGKVFDNRTDTCRF